ncbi:MAG TPA: hypothetical protein VLZ07_05670 [Syntrophales bacterium]|nr:hypothetical protein [Syntrophales bacterium]
MKRRRANAGLTQIITVLVLLFVLSFMTDAEAQRTSRQAPAAAGEQSAATSALTAACVMRDQDMKMPLYSAPESGMGYAMSKLGPVKRPDEAREKCTDAVFQQVMAAYCKRNSNPAQWSVVTFDVSGNPKTTECAKSSCSFHSCLMGACVTRDVSTNVPPYTAPDSGKGYAMSKLGLVQSVEDAKRKCAEAIFNQLMATYCKNNGNPAQWNVVTFGSRGKPKISRCAESHCDSHPCVKTQQK